MEGIRRRATESVTGLVDGAFVLIDLVPVPGSGTAADWLAGKAGPAIGEELAGWVAKAVVSRTTGAVRSGAHDAIEQWLTDDAVRDALAGTWLGDDAAPSWPETRDSLRALLDEWIVVLNGVDANAAGEVTRHVDVDSGTLTGSYQALWDLARSQAEAK
jgi:hypothetical protein